MTDMWQGGLAAAAALSATLIFAAVCPAAELSVAAASVQGPPDQEVVVPINVKGAKNLGALQLVLTYDPAMLEVVSVDQGAPGGGALVEFKAPEPGKLRIVMATLESVQGDGALFNAKFRAHGQAGQKSPLRLADIRGWEGETHLEMLVRAEDGEFAVAAGSAPLPWTYIWIALGGLAALIVIILLAALLRRKRNATPA